MKTKLKPSAREKKRYLLLEMQLDSLENKKLDEISKMLEETILDFLGTFGYAKACPEILEINKKNSTIEVILAINRKELDKVRASLCLSQIQICVKKVSGTLKKLKEG